MQLGQILLEKEQRHLQHPRRRHPLHHPLMSLGGLVQAAEADRVLSILPTTESEEFANFQTLRLSYGSAVAVDRSFPTAMPSTTTGQENASSQSGKVEQNHVPEKDGTPDNLRV